MTVVIMMKGRKVIVIVRVIVIVKMKNIFFYNLHQITC